MGWTIEYLAGNTPTRTYSWMDEVMGLVWNQTRTQSERGALGLIYRETTQAGRGHFKMAPEEAAAAAVALRSVGKRLPSHRATVRDHIVQVEQLAAAAETAARSRRPWHWS